MNTYKIIYSRPVIQQGGLYEVFYDEFWLPSPEFRAFETILKSLNNEPGKQLFPYKFCIEEPTPPPLLGNRYAHIFTCYPVVGAIKQSPEVLQVITDPEPSLSTATQMGNLLTEVSALYESLPHFNYGDLPEVPE